ncbi:hypothetical protein EDF87_103186 [Pseudomonas helmanticensis]|uniref:Uncharacterized protein n=1 Tax=Pseudomonas helmanticensis TaxID=1471381 RepID=A0A4R7VM23_9PSED|nr:hypothetical protein EDF87_103186 [Pseudomonas helmanticensis]
MAKFDYFNFGARAWLRGCLMCGVLSARLIEDVEILMAAAVDHL